MANRLSRRDWPGRMGSKTRAELEHSMPKGWMPHDHVSTCHRLLIALKHSVKSERSSMVF